MTSNFAVRQLVLTFIPTREQKVKYRNMVPALNSIMHRIFGDYQSINGNTIYLYIPRQCSVFELRETIILELKKHEVLKGLKFKIDLSAKPSEI